MNYTKVIGVVGVLAFAGATVGQDVNTDELRARLEQGKPLWDVNWKVSENGVLLMSPDPIGGAPDDWMPVFGNLVPDGIANFGLIGWLNVFASGTRDLASLTDGEFHFTAWGLDASPEALRKLAVTPVVDKDPEQARRLGLNRILAVRLLQQRGIEQARPELAAVADDPDADPFLRRAAEDAVNALEGQVETEVSTVPSSSVAALPADADVLFFFDQARIPTPFFLPPLGRELGMRILVQDLEAAGGFVSPATLAGGQWMADIVPLAPFEFARRYGNARIDWSMGAFRVGQRPADTGLWVEARGMFEVDRIAASLQRAGIAWDKGEPFRFDESFLNLDVELEDESLRAVSRGFEPSDDPERERDLRASGLGDSAIWLHFPSGSQALAEIPLPVALESATLQVGFEDGIGMTLRTGHESEQAAQGMAQVLGGFRAVAEQALDAKEQDPEVVKVLGLLRAAKLEVDGDSCVVRVDIRGVTTDDLRAFLRLFELR